MKRASATLIGAFVVVAVILAVLAVAVIGSGRLFSNRERFILYFPGAVDGLKLGAPVRYRGVDIGSVPQILLHYDQAPDDQRIPVFVDLDENKVVSAGGEFDFSPERIQVAIDRGVRAQLQSESLLTGLLFVQLDFVPDSQAKYFGLSHEYPEIPTVPTALEQAQTVLRRFLDKIEHLDIDRLFKTTENAVISIDKLVNSPEIHEVIASLDQALDSVRTLSASLNTEIQPVLKSFVLTSDRTRNTLAELESTLKSTRSAIAPDSALAYQLGRTLQEISQAARSIRAFADALDRDPSMLLRGRTIDRRED